jgi:hypothetical protein
LVLFSLSLRLNIAGVRLRRGIGRAIVAGGAAAENKHAKHENKQTSNGE